MIARHWRGWTKPEDADAYEKLLRDTVLPEIQNIEGHKGVLLLRNDGPQECQFVVINFFESLDAVKRFAGNDYRVPVFEPEARRLLSRVDPFANHFDVRAAHLPE
ncbi:antibiotic biosynthesis monooxygenase family protein [Occallatibacter riparius]|uniref:Antibiotic biosynthesis monooxygenase n=1 Tax=Occallatibacter riparius TaxID=1002689 RepID=A0A9J7BNA3_9BACT|nr:antibiotic biosynthesis monooxygenase [Occallatibacter riparius]UWZ82653.1 antibiotic biosynthesis monooxygenase [Occallatibacter riparius]